MTATVIPTVTVPLKILPASFPRIGRWYVMLHDPNKTRKHATQRGKGVKSSSSERTRVQASTQAWNVHKHAMMMANQTWSKTWKTLQKCRSLFLTKPRKQSIKRVFSSENHVRCW
ncbi:unnamed protein product [Ectocarpus sp. 8 AP-2014]